MQGPAGYGKSTFAAQWCRSDSRPAAWISLRESDNDVVQLLHRLTMALEELDPVDPGLLSELNTPEPAIETALFPRFLDDLAVRVPTLLCLDDAHVINHPSAVAVMKGLANSIPEGSQLVLVSRTRPRVGLARIRAAGDLHEVGATDLALDEVETRELFTLAGIDLSDEETTELCAVTEGWPAALALTVMSRSRADRASELIPLAARQRDIADFFREEVLDRESDDVRQFLLATSVLDSLSGPLCDAVTGRADSALLLRELADTNLFIIPMDDGREWFRYHHLFQELLQLELQRSDQPTEDLFNRAAAWHESQGDPTEAFEYARRGNDFDRAGRVLLRHWDEYLGAGRSAMVMRWLDRCDESDIESDPQFAAAAGWITGNLGDAERANRYLAAAERANLDTPSADGATSLRASMLLLRASLGTRGAVQMLEDARAFVASELPARSRLLFEGYLAVGLAYLLLGQPAEAIGAFSELVVLTEANPDPHHVYARAYGLGLLALAHADRGDWTRADHAARMAEQLLIGRDLVLHRLPMLTARATIAANAGDREACAAAIAEARAIMPTALAIPYLQAELSLRCAQAAHQSGDDDTAMALAWDAQMACRRLDDPGSTPMRLSTLRERMAGMDPLVASLSPAERRVLRQLATHRTRQEIADRLYVSPATIKSHIASIYAKLGVNARDDAVAALGHGLPDVDPDVMPSPDIGPPLRRRSTSADPWQ